VLLCDRNSTDEVISSIRELGGKAYALQIDVQEPTSGNDVVNFAVKTLGGVDVLIHNAAINVFGTTENTSDDDLQRVFSVNFFAAYRLSHAAIPEMRRRGGGNILFTGAVAGSMSLPNCVAYSTSKAALAHLARCIAIDHGRDGIRANCVSPGPVNSPMLLEAARIFSVPPESFRANVPTGTIAEPDEIAELFSFLVGPAGRSINGHAITVDGGMSAGFFMPRP
jgi:NAD(P)-dependent dehydrogenase (short-subunit alcohol dehydrogenase family)